MSFASASAPWQDVLVVIRPALALRGALRGWSLAKPSVDLCDWIVRSTGFYQVSTWFQQVSIRFLSSFLRFFKADNLVDPQMVFRGSAMKCIQKLLRQDKMRQIGGFSFQLLLPLP